MQSWKFGVSASDGEALKAFGQILDRRCQSLDGHTTAMAMAEEWLRVRPRDGGRTPLRMNAVQQRFEERRGRHNIVLKARQLGLTTWTAARFFLKTITLPGTLTLQVAHTQDSAEEIFRIVHRFLDGLPEEWREGPLWTSHSNVRQIVFPNMDCQYRVVSAGDPNAGRGLTVQNLHCSELARWPGHPEEILAGLRAGLAPGAESILESTPDGMDGCFYEEWQNAPRMGMVRHFFPWWLEDRYRAEAVDAASLSEDEIGLIEREHLDLEQIGFRRQVRASFRGLARQEYAEDAETCFKSSGDAVFELEAIESRIALAPAAIEQRRNGEMTIWLPPLPGKRYLVAVDPAGGGSEGDYSAAQVVDTQTGLQCAEFAGHVGGTELATLVASMASEYNQAWLVVERNNHGSGILALLAGKYSDSKIYRQQGQQGWLTTSISRPAMLGRLNAALVEHPEMFMSRRLLAECRSFVRMRDGSTGARAGTHDDCVMAMAIGLAARAELLERGNRAA